MGTPIDALALGGAQALFDIGTGSAASDKEYELIRRLQKHDQQFQRDMRDTAYQSMTDDMKKAGINPAVALSGGGGTVMGGSSSASAPNVNYGNVDLASILGSVNQTALTKSQQENIEADTDLKQKQSGKTQSEIKLNHQRAEIDKALASAEIAMKAATTQKEKAIAKQTYQLALNQKIKNMYEAMYGRQMPNGALDWVFSRVYGKAMQMGGSTTGLEPIINELIEQYEKKK